VIYIVIPVFNEAPRWNHEYFLQLSFIKKVKLVFVNDGSTDISASLISNLILVNPAIEILNLERNVGKAEAVRLGLKKVLKNPDVQISGFLDSDGAFSLSDISRITSLAWSEDDDSNSVWWWSSRIKLAGSQIERSKVRHAIGRIVATSLYSKNFSLPYDTQAGFKLFKVDDFFKNSLEEPFRTKWFVDLEILYRYRRGSKTFPNIEELPLTTWKEIPGSKLGIRDALDVVREVLVIKSMQNQHYD
jgi:dolichyl-phosphate beta-glucosyltransferase